MLHGIAHVFAVSGLAVGLLVGLIGVAAARIAPQFELVILPA
jgi:predicted membrane metal-binding protein